MEDLEHNHNLSNTEYHDREHGHNLERNYSNRAEELLVYASATCTYHTYGGSPYTVVPTCTTSGYTYLVCTKCGAKNKYNNTAALGHNYSQVTTQATCSTTGIKKCSRCSSTTSIPKTGSHSFTVTSSEATCTSSGTKKCANCTETQSIAVLGHKFEGNTYTVNATCTTEGYSYVKCSRCGAKNKFNTKSALGHNYTEITKVATCITAGTQKCSRCTSATTIPATGVHSYTITSVAATCTSSGTKKCANCTATQSIAVLGHKFEGSTYTVPATCTTEGYSYVMCSRCSTENQFDTKSALGHNFTEITKAATCIATGTKKCSRCTSTTTVPVTGVHSYTITSVAATCTSGGVNQCINCTATHATSALYHKFEGQPYTVPATCTAGGYSYTKCSRCTAENKFDITEPAGHSYTVVVKSASCEEPGTNKCSRCISTTQTSALGHMFGGQPYTVPASCTSEGYSYVKCSRCTAENKYNLIPAVDHSYTEVIKPATCITAGTNKCSRCTSTISIPATSVHNYVKQLAPATCTGTGTKQCDTCTDTKSISELGHKFEGETYTVPATCSTGGYSYVKCSRCTTNNKFNHTTALEHNYTEVVEAASCTAQGIDKCSRCSSTTSTEALEHMFGGEPYIVVATCTEGGYSYILCSRCKTEKNIFDVKPNVEHNYNKVIEEATCEAEGIYKCSKCTSTEPIAATGHTFKSTYTNNSINHWKKCEKCEEVIEKAQHKFGTDNICTTCKYTIIEITEVKLTNIPLELFTGKVYTVNVEVSPINANDRTLTWSSSNSSVATVSNDGVITPIRDGNVTITATTKYGVTGSINVKVHSIMELPVLQIGEEVSFGDLPACAVTFVQGIKSIMRINDDNTMVTLDAGEAVILVEGMKHQYYHVKVIRQEKLTKQQVIKLAGPAPMIIPAGAPNGHPFTFRDITFDWEVGGSLADYYRYEVYPKLKGIPLDTDHSILTSKGNDVADGFGEWLWMMYGYMAPTKEELVHMSLDILAFATIQIPIVGSVAEGVNAYLYALEGDDVKTLLAAGVFIISVIGDCFQIADIARTVKYRFSLKAGKKLDAISDITTRSKIATILDDFYAKESVRAISRYGDDIAQAISKYGDDAIDIITWYGDSAAAVITEYGDDVVKAITKFEDEAFDVISLYKDPAIKAMGVDIEPSLIYRLDDLGINPVFYPNYGIVSRETAEAMAETITRCGDDAVAAIRNYGNKAYEAIAKYGNDAVGAMKNGIDPNLITRLDDLGIKPKYYMNYNIVSRQTAETVAESLERSVTSARAAQTAGGYLTDEFTGTILTKGSKIYGLTPGQTAWYTTGEMVEASGYSYKSLYNGLQIRPDPVLGYRQYITVYEVTEDVAVATGKALANTTKGSGGYTQYFMEEYSNYLRPVQEFPLHE